MGWYPPPVASPVSPRLTVIPAGTTLFRLHSGRFEATEFNPTDPDSPEAGGGGRFDSPGGAPPFLYAADSIDAAIAEALLRDLPFAADGARELPAVALKGRCISRLRLIRALTVIALHGEGLNRVGQDAWLVRSEASEYANTRAWGAAIRRWVPEADGLQWRPRHYDDGLAVCLYQNRAGQVLEVISTLPLQDGEGLAAVRKVLARFGVASPVSGVGPMR